jgi:hypothetical protein
MYLSLVLRKSPLTIEFPCVTHMYVMEAAGRTDEAAGPSGQQGAYPTPAPAGKPATTLSKKRYGELEQFFRVTVNDEDVLHTLMTGVREIMKFDPGATRYTPELGRKITVMRKARVERLVKEAEKRGEDKALQASSST